MQLFIREDKNICYLFLQHNGWLIEKIEKKCEREREREREHKSLTKSRINLTLYHSQNEDHNVLLSGRFYLRIAQFFAPLDMCNNIRPNTQME